MKEVKVYDYYAFGYNYYLIHYLSPGIPIHGPIDGTEDSLMYRLTSFFKTLDDLNLQVTNIIASDLKKIIDEIKIKKKDEIVDDKLANRVCKEVEKLNASLDAELQLRLAYIITQKRFPIKQLLSNPDRLFANGIFNKLQILGKYDFIEAIKCIAFDLPTSAAFHILRGTEGVLRMYYHAIVKRGRVKTPMWYNMLEHLKKRKDSPPKPLISNLDGIRTNFRNPTQHPEKRYDMDEAQDLLGVTVDVINRMIKDMDSRSA